MSTAVALQVNRLCKSFGALRVTNEVSLSVETGARHALIGPNGAGKTTFVNLVSGLLKPTSGEVIIAGTPATHLSPERRVRLGLVRTFQITSLFPRLTVGENVALALSARSGQDAALWGRIDRQAGLVDELSALLERLQLLNLAATRVESLAYGQRRLVEIALALALQPKILLLDEPAAGLTSVDRERLLRLLQALPKEVTVLIIEHDMSLVFGLADRITVLVEGAVLTEGTVSAVRGDPRVRDVYLGTRAHA